MNVDEHSIAGHIDVQHGKLHLKVPRAVFIGPEAVIDDGQWDIFRVKLQSRYPWVTENALEIILNNSRKEMLRVLWDEKKGAKAGRELLARGYAERSIDHLQSYLNDHPDDSDAWYALGESFCKVGRNEEGYAAFRKGRELF